MPRYYSYNEDAFRPSNYSSNTRVKDPKDQAVVSKSGAAPKGYYQAGTQVVSNKAGQQTYNIFRPLKIEEPKPEAPAPEINVDPPPPQEPPKPQGPDYGQQIADAMAAADARMADLMNQFKIQQAAAEERQRLAAEAQRQQMLTMARRDRAAGRAPNLQIRGAGETPRTAGTQGFRRRKDQFRITPFQGIGGILGVAGQVAQGAANKMVNI